MIRVLHIAPGIDGGGIGSTIYNYLSHMNRKDIHFEIAVRDYHYRQFLHDQFDEIQIPVHYITQRKENVIKHFQQIDEIMKKGHFDVVHCHDQNWSYLYLKMAECNGVHVRLAHSHTTIQYGDYIKIALSNLLTPNLKKVATGYFACGKAAGEYMWGRKIAENGSLYVMNNAIDVNKFGFDEEKRIIYRQKMGLENRTVIGHIGRFDEQKNHKFLIEIFNELLKLDAGAVLVLVGKGEKREEIEKQIKMFGIQKSVIILGQRNDVSDLMNAFDVFLLPSLYEGLPVVGIEAQANGLPCLFADTISSEVLVLPDAKYLKLDVGAAVWAREIENSVKQSNLELRYNAPDIITKKGFNIAIESEKLRKYYIAQVRKFK